MQLTDMQATIIHSCPDPTDLCVPRREGSGCGLEGCTLTLKQWVWFGRVYTDTEAVGVVWRGVH